MVQLICINRLALVLVAGEIDSQIGRAKNLQRRKTLIDRSIQTTDGNAAAADFENGSSVDHHGHALRNFQRDAIGQDGIADSPPADLIGQVIVDAVRIGPRTRGHTDDVPPAMLP